MLLQTYEQFSEAFQAQFQILRERTEGRFRSSLRTHPVICKTPLFAYQGRCSLERRGGRQLRQDLLQGLQRPVTTEVYWGSYTVR